MSAARVIAIDGPAGSGKSTLARRLAEALGVPYVNTGLMYRAVTVEALFERLDLDDGPALGALARRMRFDLNSKVVPNTLLIEGEPPSPEIASSEVELHVSRVSSHPEVRAVLRAEQRRLGEGGAVMEGRDIGTVVFPDAAVKIFLLAEPGERATRRIRERAETGGAPEPPRVAEALAARDEQDARVNPLVPAADAVPIETTGKDADAVFREALALVRERLGERPGERS